MTTPATDRSRRSLLDHAARLLVGTGVDPSQVFEVASSAVPHASPAAAALRDGWRAADRQVAT